MQSFIDLIRDLVSTLFTGDFRVSRKRRELRKTVRELRQRNPDVFKPRTSEVLPVFGEALHALRRHLRALARLFDRTILHEHQPTAELYRDHLVEAVLSEEDRLAKAGFRYETMGARTAGAASFESALRDLSAELDAWLALFRRPEFADFNREAAQVERLAALTRFPLDKLLVSFDPGLASPGPQYQPEFSPVLVSHLTQDLMDLYFSLAGFEAGAAVAEHVVHLHRRLMKIPDADDEAKIRNIVGRINALVGKYFSRQTLLSLIRLGSDNPSLVLPEDREAPDCLGQYLRRLRARFDADRDRLRREHAAVSVAAEVTALFGDRPLPDLAGYEEALSGELAAAGLEGFSRRQPARLLKGFVTLIFEPSIKEHMKALLIEGFFENRNFQERFAGFFHQAQSVVDDLARLEQTLTGPEEVSVAAIRRALEKHRGSRGAASLARLVETVNDNVGRLIASAARAFADFGGALGELLEDAKARAPSIMSNIRTIGGDRNPARLAELADDAEKLGLFISIMKHFTVVDGRPARPGAGGRTP